MLRLYDGIHPRPTLTLLGGVFCLRTDKFAMDNVKHTLCTALQEDG